MVHLAVFQLNMEKALALALDVLSIVMYEEFEVEIKRDLLRVFVKFHCNEMRNQSINIALSLLCQK